MKIIAILFFWLLAKHSPAQRVGVKTGLALVTYSATEKPPVNPSGYTKIYDITVKPGFVLGSFLDFELSKTLWLRSGAELVVKGGTQKGTYISNGTSYPFRSSTNFTAVDFPFLLLYKTGRAAESGWLLGGGLVPGILAEGGLNKGDLGASLQAGYQFHNGLQSLLTYHHGLLNVATHHYTYESLRNRHVALTVGYRFGSSPATARALPTPVPQATTAGQPAQSLYAELGGSGGFLSLNYDTRLSKKNKGWGIRIGMGAIIDLHSVAITFPFGLNYLAGETSHFFEMGLGATYFGFTTRNQDSWFSFENEKFFAPWLWTGYRYQPPDKRFVFRAGFNQFLAAGFGGFIRYPFPGFSFGYSIK